MSTSQSEQDVGKETQARYVEELAGPNDAWISITDAARMTRTSEAMARRWVSSGRLPVKRQPVGMNQRTRLVRLSDVAAIRPIIDPAAAITDEIRKLDLPSIPRQQEQIMRDHEYLSQQLCQEHEAVGEVQRNVSGVATQLQDTVEEFRHQFVVYQDHLHSLQSGLQEQRDVLSAQILKQAETLQEMNNIITEQDQRLRHELELQGAIITAQREEIQREVDHKLSLVNQIHRQRVDQLHRDLTAGLQQHRGRLDAALQEMKDTLALYERRQEQLQQDLATQQQALLTQQEALTKLITHQVRESQTILERYITQQVQERTTLGEHLERIEQRLEQDAVRAEAEQTMHMDHQKRISIQEDQIQRLTTQLQNQVEEHKTFSVRLTTQQEYIQTLARELDAMKHIQKGT